MIAGASPNPSTEAENISLIRGLSLPQKIVLISPDSLRLGDKNPSVFLEGLAKKRFSEAIRIVEGSGINRNCQEGGC